MKKLKNVHAKLGELFKKELIDIKIKRLVESDKKTGKMLSDTRITNAITKAKNWPLVKKEVIDMPREEDIYG